LFFPIPKIYLIADKDFLGIKLRFQTITPCSPATLVAVLRGLFSSSSVVDLLLSPQATLCLVYHFPQVHYEKTVAATIALPEY